MSWAERPRVVWWFVPSFGGQEGSDNVCLSKICLSKTIPVSAELLRPFPLLSNLCDAAAPQPEVADDEGAYGGMNEAALAAQRAEAEGNGSFKRSNANGDRVYEL